MQVDFERRLQAAAVSGWWTILVAAVLLTASWFAYLAAMAIHPDWLNPLWGREVTWETMENVWLWAMVVYKLILWIFVMIVLWMTLWARQLRKQAVRELTAR
ncbi:MAG: hypothetical protein ABUL64_03015 [Singulisphaera sp.]